MAHLSRHEILEEIAGYETAWGSTNSMVPHYHEQRTHGLYLIHAAMVMKLVEELRDLFRDLHGYKMDKRESDVLDVAYSILKMHGAFKG